MNRKKARTASMCSALVALAFFAACSSSSTPDSGAGDAGAVDARPDASIGGTDAGGMDAAEVALNLKPFTAPMDPGAVGVLFTASGEAPAVTGWAFPPQAADDTFMVDGWAFELKRFIAVIDNITLWSEPDLVPADQSMHGPMVAEVKGPWIIDLHKGGPLSGKGGGGEQALAIAAVKTMSNGQAFDATMRYAFGFDAVAASATAIDVNLTNPSDSADSSAALEDYRYMVQNGYSVLYVGTATFRASSCTQPGATSSTTYDFSKLPSPMQFRMGFNTPTSYVNCQNGTDFPGVPGVNGEDHPRGVQFKSTASIIGQVTLHMDHPFWESFAENSPIHWDQIAAQFVGMTSPVAHTEDMKNVDFTAFTDSMGKSLPWRTCVSSSFYMPPGTGQMHFNPLHVPVNPAATDPSKALRDYYDYIRYTQATQGHLNSQGLCFIARNYPSPPGGS
jgi:hypothetical protein